MEEFEVLPSDFDTDELIGELEDRGLFIYDPSAIKNEVVSNIVCNCGQRMLFQAFCDLVNVNHLSPKQEVLDKLNEYLSKIA